MNTLLMLVADTRESYEPMMAGRTAGAAGLHMSLAQRSCEAAQYATVLVDLLSLLWCRPLAAPLCTVPRSSSHCQRVRCAGG